MVSQVCIAISRFMCVLVVSVVISSLGFGQALKTECRSVMTSVRMEVSPLMVHAICRDNSSAVLAITCGEAVWVEDIQGFCNSFDLNIGQVLMNQTLPSTTITLHLVKLGQILDAARVVILTSQEVRHYRISVWGHQNTRFVLTIASRCPPDNAGQTSKPFRDGPSPADDVALLSTTPPNWTPTSISPTGAPSHGTEVTENNAPLPEYSRPNNLPKSQLDVLRSSPTTIFSQRSAMSRGRKKVNMHRSKVPVSPNDSERERILLNASQKGDHVINVENSELAKLQWMEDRRVLFEKKFELLQKQFQVNSSGEDYKDYNTDSVEDVSRELNISPSDVRQASPDYHRKINDVTYSPKSIFVADFKEIKLDSNNTINNVVKTAQKQDARELNIGTTTLTSKNAAEIQVLSNKKQESFQTLRPVKLSFRTLNNEALPLVVSERESLVPEAAIEVLSNTIMSSVSNESLVQATSPASTSDGGLPLFLNFPLELLSENHESSSASNLLKTTVIDEQVIPPSVAFSESLFTISPSNDSISSTGSHVMILDTSSGNIMSSVEFKASSTMAVMGQITGMPSTLGITTDSNSLPASSWRPPEPTEGISHVSVSQSAETTSTHTLISTSHYQLIPTFTVGHTSELSSTSKQDVSSQQTSYVMSSSLSFANTPDINTGIGTSSSPTNTLTFPPSTTATLASMASSYSPEPVQTSSSKVPNKPSTTATIFATPSTWVTETKSDVTTTQSTTAQSSTQLNRPTLPNISIGIPVLPTGDGSGTTVNATSHPEGNEGEGISDAQFWPLVASLVIGIPAIVVIGIGVTVIHRRRKPDPQKMYHMKALRATGTPKMSAGSDTLRSTMMHQTSVEV